MFEYRSFKEIVDHPGLRIVLVKGLPSPWGQAAKTIFEIKERDYVAAPWMPGEPNAAIAAWGGEASAPLVVWQKEQPIHRWINILYLAERLAPQPSLIPTDAMRRALMFGLSHEICGELGLGWNRRIHMFAPAYASGHPPEAITRMGGKYGYNEGDARMAGDRVAQSLNLLAGQLKLQRERGSRYFIGDRLTAVDIYWTAMSVLLDPLPKEDCPMMDGWRSAFALNDPIIKAALDPILLEHRMRTFRECFRNPMEL
jgi:glutathione S-transferase